MCALAPLFTPLNALPDEAERLTDPLDLDCAALGVAAARFALEAPPDQFPLGLPAEGRAAALPVAGLAPALLVGGRAATLPVEGRAPTLPVEGLAPALPVEGRAPPDPQPRASAVRAVFAAVGEPLLLSRLWSGCHFFCAPVALVWPAAVVRAVLTLAFRLTLTFWL